jgi:DNA repair exonuclease SbcCD ATPase subunit
MEGTLTLHQEQLRALRGERANLDATEIKARLGDICPVCRVPIDRALAEGCHISRILPDAAAAAEERRTVADQMQDCNSAIGACQTDIATKKRSLTQLRQKQAGIENRIGALETEIDHGSRQNRQRWAGKQRVMESVTELQRTYDDVALARRSSGELTTKAEQLRDRQAELRASHQDVLGRFGELFGYVCRGVLGNNISASVSLTGLGIQADVQVGGMAMESLKAIAFDLRHASHISPGSATEILN